MMVHTTGIVPFPPHFMIPSLSNKLKTHGTIILAWSPLSIEIGSKNTLHHKIFTRDLFTIASSK
jgi:hypothetical protein